MNWVTILWSMIVSACLTMAAMQFFVWCQKRRDWSSLLFAVSAFSTAGLAAVELWMMRAGSTDQFGEALRWIQVPSFGITLGLIGFVRCYLRAGRLWLGEVAIALRTLALVLGFLMPPNLQYREITALRHIPFLGDSVATAVGVPNPWVLTGQLSLLMFLVFLVDATVTTWRRGDRRQALAVGGSLVLCALSGVVQSVLIFRGYQQWPVCVSGFFLLVIVAISYEMGRNLFQAGQLAEDLRESQKLVVLATAAARIGLWTRDLKQNEIQATSEWRTMFGFDPVEPLSFDRFMERLHPEDRLRVRSTVEQATAKRHEYQAEYRLVLPGGRICWIASHGWVETDRRQSDPVLHGLSMDITELKLAQEKFQLAVEASPNSIVMTNSGGQIVLVNQGTEKLFGYSRADLIGQSPDMLMAARFRAGHAEKMKGYLAAPHVRTMGQGGELFGRRKDGTEFPLEIGLSPIQSAEGMMVLTVIVDITARKQAEAEMFRQRAELAHVARVSTMGALAGSLAHELNQPLSAILNNAQAATRFLAAIPPDLGEVRGALEDIAHDTKRAGEVIRQMRSMVRRDEPDRKPLEINRVLADVARLLHSESISRKVQVTLALDPAPIRVSGDSVQLKQVVLNLVLNAFDAIKDSPEERREVVLRTRRREAGLVLVEVQDGGIGIPPESLGNLFEPFRSSKKEGLGLGLSISKSIVVAHEGRIWAENNAGPGATVCFELPVLAGEHGLS